jgi:hypothetical protein
MRQPPFVGPGSACGCESAIVVQPAPFFLPLRSPPTVAEQTFLPRRSRDCASRRGEHAATRLLPSPRPTRIVSAGPDWNLTLRFNTKYAGGADRKINAAPREQDGHFPALLCYVERNAQRAGWVKRAVDWSWSSGHARRYKEASRMGRRDGQARRLHSSGWETRCGPPGVLETVVEMVSAPPFLPSAERLMFSASQALAAVRSRWER